MLESQSWTFCKAGMPCLRKHPQQQGHGCPGGRKTSAPSSRAVSGRAGNCLGAATIYARVPPNTSGAGRHVNCRTTQLQDETLPELMEEEVYLSPAVNHAPSLISNTLGLRNAQGASLETLPA